MIYAVYNIHILNMKYNGLNVKGWKELYRAEGKHKNSETDDWKQKSSRQKTLSNIKRVIYLKK